MYQVFMWNKREEDWFLLNHGQVWKRISNNNENKHPFINLFIWYWPSFVIVWCSFLIAALIKIKQLAASIKLISLVMKKIKRNCKVVHRCQNNNNYYHWLPCNWKFINMISSFFTVWIWICISALYRLSQKIVSKLVFTTIDGWVGATIFYT